MNKRVWQIRLLTSVLVALVGLVGLAEFLPHTDDGCAVEVHCVACRAHMSAATTVAPSSGLVAGVNVFIGLGAVLSKAADEAPVRSRPPGRAPPLSA